MLIAKICNYLLLNLEFNFRIQLPKLNSPTFDELNEMEWEPYIFVCHHRHRRCCRRRRRCGFFFLFFFLFRTHKQLQYITKSEFAFFSISVTIIPTRCQLCQMQTNSPAGVKFLRYIFKFRKSKKLSS